MPGDGNAAKPNQFGCERVLSGQNRWRRAVRDSDGKREMRLCGVVRRTGRVEQSAIAKRVQQRRRRVVVTF